MAWAPMDDTGCFDHVGWRKRSVYVPAVKTVQQAEKLLMVLVIGQHMTSIRDGHTGASWLRCVFVHSDSCG